MALHVLNTADLKKMRASCKLAGQVLEFIGPHVEPGVTTGQLDKLCHDFIVARGAYPSPLNYKGFPKSICTSINEVVCHGIPGERTLQEGDIINIDITVYLDGFHGDTSDMFFVGKVSANARRLVDITRHSLWLGIKEVGPGKHIGDIGAAIEEYAAGRHGYGIVTQFCGHGIGPRFHMPPQVNHTGRRGTGPVMRPGNTFTIEPMINEGTGRCEVLRDGWTAVTGDHKLSAQAEHTILVTESGYEVLTLREGCYRP